VGQLLPLAPLPLAHVHFLVAHARFSVRAGALLSYWCVKSQVSSAVHTRSLVVVGAVLWYWVPVHVVRATQASALR
jgi:hypothetical protein